MPRAKRMNRNLLIELRRALVRQMAKTNESVNAAEVRIGLPQKTLRDILAGDRNPTISTLRKVCDGLEIKIGFQAKSINRQMREGQ